jgi:ribosomal protein S18 acetylase RimI-like enzyme
MARPGPGTERATEASTLADAAMTLAEAFRDTRLFATVLPSRARRQTALPPLFAAMLRSCRRHGRVLTLDGGAAVAAWLPGRRLHPSVIDVVTSGLVLAPWYLGVTATLALRRHEGGVRRALVRATTPGTAYLAFVGVRPDAQGTGAGRRAVDAALESMRRAGLERCLLATDDEANVGLYTHLGFSLVEHLDDLPSGIESWVMDRRISDVSMATPEA